VTMLCVKESCDNVARERAMSDNVVRKRVL